MSWRDNLRPASFRGVEFHYEDVRRGNIGRRVKRHDYPGGEESYHEDLGIETPSIDITAYVLEPDHINKAARLSEVLLEKGPGTLVHPYYGEISVVALPATETFTTREGGMARFSLRFERAGPNRNPSARVDTTSLLSTNAAAIETQAASDFALSFNVDGAPGWVEDFAEDDFGTVLPEIQTAQAGGMTDAADLANLAFDIADMTANATSLIRNPASLASRVTAAMQSAPGIGPGLKLATSAFSLGSIAATTPSRLLQSNNRTAMLGLINQVALASAVRNIGATTFETSADAYAARDDIAAAADTMSLTAGDGMVRALSKGVAAVTRHVSAAAPALPRLVTKRPTATRPTIVHAYDLFGDDVAGVIAQADKIATRNAIRHPGFVPAGLPMEVLSNA